MPGSSLFAWVDGSLTLDLGFIHDFNGFFKNLILKAENTRLLTFFGIIWKWVLINSTNFYPSEINLSWVLI